MSAARSIQAQVVSAAAASGSDTSRRCCSTLTCEFARRAARAAIEVLNLVWLPIQRRAGAGRDLQGRLASQAYGDSKPVEVVTAVSGSGVLPERDLRALSAVVEDGLRDAPSKVIPWAVLEGLLRLIPSDGVQIEERDPRGRRIVAQQALTDGGQRCTSSDLAVNDTHYWTLSEQFQPNSYPIRSGDAATPIRYSDFYTFSELRQIPFYIEYLAPDRDGLNMLLSTGTHMCRRLSLWRSRHDFDERDRLILQLLRPHLHEVFLDAQRRRRGMPHLSRREQQVLHLVSQGYSNADIARILFISPATVAKHMEHIFDRTGVRDRNAAAALALPNISPFNTPSPER